MVLGTLGSKKLNELLQTINKEKKDSAEEILVENKNISNENIIQGIKIEQQNEKIFVNKELITFSYSGLSNFLNLLNKYIRHHQSTLCLDLYPTYP